MQLYTLFIGNSHTYLNFMPQMLGALTRADDHDFELHVDQCTGEGASLEWHWNNPQSRDAIRQRPWDFVVLQDRSGGPLEDPDSFVHHAGLLDTEINKQGAKTVFFMTWANRQRPDTQVTLTAAYTNLAKEFNAIVSPVGMAWEAVHRVAPDFDLHHRDGRHANPAGSYLTACVFYAVLFSTTPQGLPGTFFYKGKKRLDLKKDKALLLQKAAWETVLNAGMGMKAHSA